MMKISELINKLQTLKDLHGDLRVETYWDFEYIYTPIDDENVYYEPFGFTYPNGFAEEYTPCIIIGDTRGD